MSTPGVLAIGAVALQLCATVLLQPFHRNRLVGWLDTAALIPMWLFFAFGDPGEDWRLMVRDGIDDTPSGEWRRLGLGRPRRLTAVAWAPDKHPRTELSTLMMTLAQRAAREPDLRPEHSVAFARLLAIVGCRCSTDAGPSRQFAIVRVDTDGSPHWLYTSRLRAIA